MLMVQKWTGRESLALREAMRVSQRDFADQLGITGRSVAKWEAGGISLVPRPDSQAILDTKLRQVSDEVRARFALSLGIGRDEAGSASPAPESGEASKAPPTLLSVLDRGDSPPTAAARSTTDESRHGEIVKAAAQVNKVPRPARPPASKEATRDLWETAYDSDEELMKRRAFLINLAALAGLGTADTPAAIEAIRQNLNLSLVDERAGTQADEWQDIILDYGEIYPTAAPAELIRALMVDMLGMQEALRRHNDTPQQRDLLRAASLLSAFTAQAVANVGQPVEARRWWRTARNAADRSGDPYSALWVRGREIVRAMESRPVPAILQLIEEAEGITGQAPPEATLELIAAKAQSLALAGRSAAATETLTQLRKQFSKSPSGYSGSMLSWGQERLHNTESFTYSRLGLLSNAESATADGLSLYAANSPTNLRHPAQLQLNLAFALVISGDVGEGLNHARNVITALPVAHRGMRVNDGVKLLGMVPLPEQRRADVREYREWVNSLAER